VRKNIYGSVKSACAAFLPQGKIFRGRPSGGTGIFSKSENGLETVNMLQ